MHDSRFNEILDYLCSGIMSKSERQSVRDELYDHLMCKYETNIACGMDEEKAAKNAIYDLGNKATLKENLQKVHWYYPAQSLKSAFYLLILGFTAPMLTFMLSGIEYMFELVSFVSVISQVCVFASLFTMRTVNRKFNQVFILNIFITVLSSLALAFEPLLSNYFVASLLISAVSSVLSIIESVFIFLGLKELTEPYGNVKLVKDAAVYYTLCLINTAISLIEINDFSGGIPRLLGILYPVLSICFYLYFIVNILKISDVLYKSDHEYKVDISVKKRSAVVAAVLLFAVVSIFGADFIYSKVDINKSDNIPYSIEDFEMEQSEYERICTNIASYGINKEWVSLMPKSEISKYSNVVNKSEMTQSAQQLLDYYDDTLGGDVLDFSFYSGDDYERRVLDHTSVYNYTVSLGYSDNGLPLVRFIKIFRVPPSATEMYKDMVAFDDYSINRMHPMFGDEPHCGDLLVAMKKEGNRLYKKDVKLLGKLEDYPIEGFVFDVEPGTIIIYATTREIKDVGATFCNMDFTYYHQKYPIMFPIRDIKNLMIIDSFSDLSTFQTFKYTSNHYYVMPEGEYVVPIDIAKETG